MLDSQNVVISKSSLCFCGERERHIPPYEQQFWPNASLVSLLPCFPLLPSMPQADLMTGRHLSVTETRLLPRG